MENPFAAASTPYLREILGGPLTIQLRNLDEGVLFRGLDANLGLPGLPQSATGQATLLTGSNGARLMGRHYGPWPGPTLLRLLDRGTLFSEVRDRGHSCRLANSYPPGYFEALASGRARANVPVYAARAAGLELAGLADYRNGAALAPDLTGEHFTSLDATLPVYTPFESGRLLASLAASGGFTFFDFWLSDRTGHRGSFAEAVALVERLDGFLAGTLTNAHHTTVVVTSDHGNLEDKGTRGHTRAPVPLLVLGPGRQRFASCSSLADVAAIVLELLPAQAERGTGSDP